MKRLWPQYSYPKFHKGWFLCPHCGGVGRRLQWRVVWERRSIGQQTESYGIEESITETIEPSEIVFDPQSITNIPGSGLW